MRKDYLKGSSTYKMSHFDLDHESLEIGTEIEFENTNNREIAKKIAMDCLSEDPDYYRNIIIAHVESNPFPKLDKSIINILSQNKIKIDDFILGVAFEFRTLRLPYEDAKEIALEKLIENPDYYRRRLKLAEGVTKRTNEAYEKRKKLYEEIQSKPEKKSAHRKIEKKDRLSDIVRRLPRENPIITYDKESKKALVDDKELRELEFSSLEDNIITFKMPDEGIIAFAPESYYTYIFETPEQALAIKNHEVNLPLFPLRVGFGMGGTKMFNHFWKTNAKNGLLGVVWYQVKPLEKMIYIEIMAVKPSHQRNRINAILIDYIMNSFEINTIDFGITTVKGEKFAKNTEKMGRYKRYKEEGEK